ncbi:galacturonosyltransferase 14 [Hordeum vulgare]|nr:galacturonosyltransferase 14 [Hordeum vulgare]
MNKVSGVKRKKVPTKKPPATPYAPARRSPTMPSCGDVSTTGKVFDERAGSRGSNNAAAEFVHLLATNAVDIDQAPINGFDYNELEGGVDDHDAEDEVKEIDEGTY